MLLLKVRTSGFLWLLCRLADRIPFQLQMDLSHATCYHAMNASTKRTFARNEHFAEIRAYSRFPGHQIDLFRIVKCA